MPWLTRELVRGIGCDRCSQTFLAAREGSWFDLREELITAATDAGWRMFANREQRWYCPDHGPTTSALRLVYPRPEEKT